MTGRTETAAGIERQLARYRDLTYRALLAQLPTREPRRYLYDLISGQLSHVGKGLRPGGRRRDTTGVLPQSLPLAGGRAWSRIWPVIPGCASKAQRFATQGEYE